VVASKDKVLSLETVGYMDVAAQKPMRADCLFWIASMSKPITATALMMLVDEGKVKLDDPVEKYLPEFQGQMLIVKQDKDGMLLRSPSRPVTVRDVLSHTSGLPFMSRVGHKIDTYPLREAALGYALTPLKSEPGTKFDYSNAGINTAGRIIEVVSRMPYEEFLDRRLLKPLGMKDTTFWPSEEQLTRLAKSYGPNAAKTGLQEIDIGQLTYPLGDRRRGPSPAGGLFSTAADVCRFCQMILGGGVFAGRRYISEQSLRQMTSTQTGSEAGYGLGWSTSRKMHGKDDLVIVGPCGHGGAYATNMWIDPKSERITIFMVQHGGFPGPDGGKILGAFTKAATDNFGPAKQ
jgi:CubicO group peptidase (beta-lactamase class C family)